LIVLFQEIVIPMS